MDCECANVHLVLLEQLGEFGLSVLVAEVLRAIEVIVAGEAADAGFDRGDAEIREILERSLERFVCERWGVNTDVHTV